MGRLNLSAELLEVLLARTENEDLDFKACIDLNDQKQRFELVKDIQAFANRHGSTEAFIICGVTENGDSSGLPPYKGDLATLSQSVDTAFDRRIEWSYEDHVVRDIQVLVLRISRASKRPVRFSGTKSYRDSETNQQKSAWTKGECLIRSGSLKRPWDAFDDEQNSSAQSTTPDITVTWMTDTVQSSSVFVDFPNQHNKIRQTELVIKEEPGLVDNIIANMKVSDLEKIKSLNQQKVLPPGHIPPNLQKLLNSSLRFSDFSVGKAYDPPERNSDEVDIEILVENTGDLFAEKIRVEVFAPEGVQFIPYWSTHHLIAFNPNQRDFDCDDEGSTEVEIRRDGLYPEDSISGQVRIKFPEPGEYKFKFECKLGNKPGVQRGFLTIVLDS